MSRMSPTEVNCPVCGLAQTVTVWDSLNADLSPEAREELFEGKINFFECSSCDAEGFLAVPLMYHDMNRRFVVQYFPFHALEEDEFLERFARDGTDSVMTEAIERLPEKARALAASDYMKRPQVVFDMGELVRYVIFRERVFDRCER